ncbi:FAD-binding protein [Verminephrobacter eiseniae]|uniref:L-aspartate oxidase n=2 Tax=Verminephrobacter eiseniae TaxID=364317 RepID=UPI0010EDE8C7|nr:FAD-binding protein [Verminephrobacter eiseniae]KAB7604297.1 FAD-binding protein [Verminephrobacter sp. Larva24]MCW5232037.1 FAD-binding protein [Verminephrobacter eiseniae]MCW5296401.1 FAD-binding protein [Verminephrobacter eiseniae]MCW8184524.1 FAD-binding protein [Verminephrobacter eiseniae]MCW8223200.1 FAD-binding protein [Verminephrobacter eiseniae]
MNRRMCSTDMCQTDILILGTGGAGLFAALHAKKASPGLRVSVAVKGLLGKCGCTRMVQGGYNVALSAGDSVERHFMDTIEGGKWLPRQDLAWRLVEGAIERVRELENEIGCFFDRNPDGTLHQKAFAGQSFDRTVHKADLTGIEIINRLMEQVRALDVQEFEEHRAIELIPASDGSGIAGVLFIDMRTGRYRVVQAKAVLLATGAGPTMYRYHTPSGDKTCDGLAMALRYGLRLRDMEMVQFHPTGLLGGPDTRMTGTVLEEGLRGAGGYLLDGSGERFMARYDARGERATRDVVSRSIYAEMRAGRTSPMGGVYLQMSHLGPEKVAKTFPGMVSRCLDCGFDLAGGRVEVVPTAHYLMGGVEFDVDCSTAAPGLFAAGEDCGGVHGANRLGGNGVANSTVFGAIAGDSMAAYVQRNPAWRDLDRHIIAQGVERAEYPFSRPPDSIHRLRSALAQTMWDEVGVLRHQAALENGLEHLAGHRRALSALGVSGNDRRYNVSWHDWLDLESLLDISKVITVCALARENSRGAHFREDFPEAGALHSSCYTRVAGQGDQLELEMVPVSFDIVRPGHSLLGGAAGQAGNTAAQGRP